MTTFSKITIKGPLKTLFPGTASDESNTLPLLKSLIHPAFQKAAGEPFGNKWKGIGFLEVPIKFSFGFVIIIFLVIGLLSCSRSNMKKLNIQKSNSNQNISLKVEIADDDQERMRGLMFRKTMPEKEGMLFIFDHDAATPFWMKNTYLSLDLIFISAQNEIVDIIENAKPLSEDLIRPNAPYRSVLEVNAGFAKKFNIETGDRVVF